MRASRKLYRFPVSLQLCMVLSALAGSLGGCPPTYAPAPTNQVTLDPGQTARLRIATLNTECIVPEMTDDIKAHIESIIEGDIPCLSEITNWMKDLANLLTLGVDVTDPLDYRNALEDATMARAQAIANHIKQNPDFDVIAFNEVFYEPARDLFVSELSGLFPHYISKVSGGTVCTEDSGLMIFSRWPIETIPIQLIPGWTISTTDEVHHEYDACNCEDCMAEKSVAYVRIRNPITDDLYHVIFTHMQADPTACVSATPINDVWDTRSSQLNDAKDLLIHLLGPAGYDAQTNVFVMGDMNVVGTSPQAAAAFGVTPSDNLEWQLKFDPSTGHYFAGDRSAPSNGSPLYDTWAQTTSPHDPGITQGTGNRLDYIFMNGFHGSSAGPLGSAGLIFRPLVPHHLMLHFDHTMSDHLGVRAIVNRYQPHCMPVEAITPQAGYTLPGLNQAVPPDQVVLGPWPNNQMYDGEIDVPGGFQWYRFDFPGTYSFSITSPSGQNDTSGFEIHVYRDTDLTFDISNYYGETTDIAEFFTSPGGIFPPNPQPIIAKKYLLPEAPFYVRISPLQDTGTGPFKLVVHRHEGRSKKDAIALPACCTQEYFHGNGALNSDDMPWFQVNLEKADSGIPQALRFIVIWDPAKGSSPMTLRLQDESDSVVAQSSTGQISDPSVDENNPAYGFAQSKRYVEVFHNNLESLGSRFYLRVGRPALFIPGSGLSSAYDDYSMRWETNLTILHGYVSTLTRPLELYCVDETCGDWSGSDEIGMSIWKDGQFSYLILQGQIGSTDVDSGDNYSLEGLIDPIRYVDEALIKVREYDAGDPADIGDMHIHTLSPKKNKLWKTSKSTSVNCSGVGGDGEYQFFYNLSRSLYYDCD